MWSKKLEEISYGIVYKVPVPLSRFLFLVELCPAVLLHYLDPEHAQFTGTT